MSEQEIILVKHNNKNVKIFCGSCKKETNHEILSDVLVDTKVVDHNYHHGEIETHQYDNYFTLQCGGCKSVVFRKTSIHSEDICQFEQEPTIDEIYPNPFERINIMDNIYNIDDEIKNIYSETIVAYNHKQPILTAVGIRTVIESICKEQEIKGKLEKKIDKLKEKGILTLSQVNTLHKLRKLGNNAVHERKIHTHEELTVALEIVEHIIKGIYDIAYKSKIFDEKEK